MQCKYYLLGSYVFEMTFYGLLQRGHTYIHSHYTLLICKTQYTEQGRVLLLILSSEWL